MNDTNGKRQRAQLARLKAVENPKGIFRTTLSFNPESMLCHFRMNKGSEVPLHNHAAVQHGYVIRGRLRFLLNEGKSFIAEPGCSYVFDSWEHHGAQILEDSEVMEFFVPMRPEYADN